MEFVKWEAYGYSSTTDPFMDPELNPNVEKKLDDHLPAVFRCTECGKYRTVKNWKELNIEPEFFNCSENPDEVKHKIHASILYIAYRNIIHAKKKRNAYLRKNLTFFRV